MLSVIEKIETLVSVMRIGSAERGKMHISISNKKVSVAPLEMTLKQKLERSERINSVNEEQPCQGPTASS